MLPAATWIRRNRASTMAIDEHVILKFSAKEKLLIALAACMPSALDTMFQSMGLDLCWCGKHLPADTTVQLCPFLERMLYQVALQPGGWVKKFGAELALMCGALLKHVVRNMQLDLILGAEGFLALDALECLRCCSWCCCCGKCRSDCGGWCMCCCMSL